MIKHLIVLLAILCLTSFARIDSITASTERPQLGDKKKFWTWNLEVMPPTNIQVDATCRGIGEHIYIFIVDSEWLTRVSQEDVAKIIEAYDHVTPATSIDPTKGIYDIATGVFGPPPDVDNDPKIYLLVSQLGKFKGHHFNGFFRPMDQRKGKHSNLLDMLFIDSDKCSENYLLGVLAHEFHHLLHTTYDKREVSWISESLAEISMVICGYQTDMRKVSKYLGYSNQPLVSKRYSNYGACLLWGMYLYDRFGGPFVSSLVKEDTHHIEGVENTLRKANLKLKFKDLFGDWMTANYVNDVRVDKGQYAYKTIPLPNPSPYLQLSGMPACGTGDVKGYGVNYIRILTNNAEDHILQLSFAADTYEDFLIRVIKINNADMSKTTVEQLEPHSLITNFLLRNSKGDDFNEIVLAITSLKKTRKPLHYSFTASFVPEYNTGNLKTL